MKSDTSSPQTAVSTAPYGQTGAERGRSSVATRFGQTVDVRNRGSLRFVRLTDSQLPAIEAPAVVRVWTGEQCRELSAHPARALAAQLLEAASHADLQNML
ncbi:hypothetical protein ACFQAT_00090 [Undibacterium arcticum]|uniref:Uncharacterized protein n=1 Tax=Undibacterium arcticum TaxID=1762892 RepID=A0ABV7FCB5_9BURK